MGSKKEAEFNDLQKFGAEFKLASPLPTEMISIVARDPEKRKALQKNALRDAQELAQVARAKEQAASAAAVTQKQSSASKENPQAKVPTDPTTDTTFAGHSSALPFPTPMAGQDTVESASSSEPSPLNHILPTLNIRYGPNRIRTPWQTSSYWSIPETRDFPGLLTTFGTDWKAIATHMHTKTASMVEMYYLRSKEFYPEWVQFAAEADSKKARKGTEVVGNTDIDWPSMSWNNDEYVAEYTEEVHEALTDNDEGTHAQGVDEQWQASTAPHGETIPISQEQLVAEVKQIYAGLAMVEAKCIALNDLPEALSASANKLDDEDWEAVTALHRRLLRKQQDTLPASQLSDASWGLCEWPGNETNPPRDVALDASSGREFNDWRIRGYNPLSMSHDDTRSLPPEKTTSADPASVRGVPSSEKREGGFLSQSSPVPDSVHDPNVAVQYCAQLRKELDGPQRDELVRAMRSYLETPRTSVGWKGLVNDPDIDASFKINKGVRRSRKVPTELASEGLPISNEMFDSLTPQHLADLITVGDVNAEAVDRQLRHERWDDSTSTTTNVSLDTAKRRLYPSIDGSTGSRPSVGVSDLEIEKKALRDGSHPPSPAGQGHGFGRNERVKMHIVGPEGTPYENGLFEFDLRNLEPPATKITLSELDANKIIHSPKLRHDINFDPELHFWPERVEEATGGTLSLIKQPETRPIPQEQLVAELEEIFAGQIMVETKCIEVDNAVNAQTNSFNKLDKYQWQALIALHRTLRHEHHVHGLNGQVDRRAMKSSSFSSGRKQYYVNGDLGGTALEAFPDTGADICLISPNMAKDIGSDIIPGTEREIRLANKKPVKSPGMIRVPWKFSGESKTHMLDCWVFPGCVHKLILGSQFLRATRTLTRFASRIKSKLVSLPSRLRLRLLGEEKQRLWGFLDGNFTAALPDTGSDVMLVSADYAREIGLTVDTDWRNWLEVEFADGSTAWTSGVARDVPWTVGGKMVYCDFHVLDELCVDVVLSNDYLFEMRVFSEHADSLFDIDSEEDLFQLCNIRLIGRFSDILSELEDEYLEDMTSPNAFGLEMVQRELSRRDLIRDRISSLPVDQRQAASQAEARRQRQWQALREEHRLRWTTGISGGPSSSSVSGGAAHRIAGQAAEDGDPGGPTRRPWWKKKVTVSIPLRYVRRDDRLS